MFKRVLRVAILLLGVASLASAQIDPQSLVGVWDGNWHFRTSERQYTGTVVITVEKVENGKVYGKNEGTNIRGENTPIVKWTATLTDTGWQGTTPEGLRSDATLQGTKLVIITQRNVGNVTTTATKRK